jgi:hypothetical protein
MEQKIARNAYHEQTLKMAGEIEGLLSTALPGTELSTATALIVAELLHLQESETFALRNLTLEDLLNVYVGQALHAKLPEYLNLHAQLEQEGAVSYEKGRTFRRDEYSIYAVPTKTYDTGGGVIAKAMVLHTLEGNFVVVLNHRFDTWTVHLRQFWPVLEEALDSESWIVGLQDYRNSTNLTLQDVAKLSSAMSHFSDDYPGVIHPARPRLASFLEGNLVVGERGEGHGLCYGDGRDTGYIASLRDARTPRANDMCYSALPYLHVVGNLLKMAKQPLSTEPD